MYDFLFWLFNVNRGFFSDLPNNIGERKKHVFEQIKKRDGRIQEFDSKNITEAIAKAGKATGEFTEREAKKLTLRVLTLAHELRLTSNPY